MLIPKACVAVLALLVLAPPQARAKAVNRPVAVAKRKVSPRVVEPVTKLEDEAPPPLPTDPDHDRILRVQEALYSLVHGPVLGRVRTAIRVQEARSGRVLYNRRSNELMDPASNQKILASAASLYRLGNNFRYRTQVHGPTPSDEGELKGDVVLRGSGDPSLSARDIDGLAAQLVALGVRRVVGNVVADRRYIGADEIAPSARSPLAVSRSAIVVRVRPGDRAGAHPVVFYEPAVDGIVVANRATTTAKGRTRIGVTIGTEGGRIVISVKGRISMRHAGVVFRRRPSTPLLYAAAILAQALNRHGVYVQGAPMVVDGAKNVDKEEPRQLLASHHSAPLPTLMRPINKNSNNEYADRLLETLGAQMYGGAPSMEKGVRALRGALSELGMPEAAYQPANGSGLGHRNRLSPEGLTNFLRMLYFDPRVGPELVQSLSVGGVDGTTQHRFAGTAAAHRVRAKTGTLNGKSCLSGYVGDESEILIFSIMVDHVRSRGVNSVRKAQVNVVETLMGYAKGLVGDAAVERPDPGLDFEVGEDVLETEEPEALPGTSDVHPTETDKLDDEGNPDSPNSDGDP